MENINFIRNKAQNAFWSPTREKYQKRLFYHSDAGKDDFIFLASEQKYFSVKGERLSFLALKKILTDLKKISDHDLRGIFLNNSFLMDISTKSLFEKEFISRKNVDMFIFIITEVFFGDRAEKYINDIKKDLNFNQILKIINSKKILSTYEDILYKEVLSRDNIPITLLKEIATLNKVFAEDAIKKIITLCCDDVQKLRYLAEKAPEKIARAAREHPKMKIWNKMYQICE